MATSPVSSLSNGVFTNFLPTFSWTEKNPVRVHREPESKSVQPEAPVPAVSEIETQREQVLLDHLPLVRYVARRIHERLPQHVELDDLVSAGILGLIDAFNKFDSGKNVQFRSYAQFRIRGAILDSLRVLDWGSRDLRRKGRNIDGAIETLTHRLHRTPTETEIADELGMPLDRYQELLADLKGLQIGSLQETRDNDSTENELDCLAAPAEEDPFQRCLQSEQFARLKSALRQLPERDARVLMLYYGEEMTLKEIGAVLGLVESRVSQLRTAAIAGLRARLGGADPERTTGLGSDRARQRRFGVRVSRMVRAQRNRSAVPAVRTA